MSELTLQRLQDRMGRYMGWQTGQWPAEVAVDVIVNEAGRALMSACEWNFLRRTPATLEIVNGQSYIELPDDFGSMEGSPVASTYAYYALRMVTPLQVADARRLNQSGATGNYVGAIVWADPTGADTMPRARIDIAPTPTTDLADAFKLSYRAGWVDLANPEDIAFIPLFMEGLLVRWCCAWLAGYEADDEGGLEDRLDRIRGSVLWESAVTQDAAAQHEIGGPANTAFDALNSDRPWHPFTIGATPTIV